jgi:hypothetical protein
MASVTVRWAGPADATSGSTYKIERTLDNASWSTLAAAQAATSPYVSVSNTLASNAAFGAATITLTSGASFGNSGYLWLDDALVEWVGKSTNDLTGCIWHSGYGTYASGSTVYVAHESYADTVTISLNAVVYRITHIDAASNESAPTYIWYFSPPAPASADHCVVVVNVLTDLGMAAQAGITVTGNLAADTSFGDKQGAHLDAQQSSVRSVQTNAFGLAHFHCWKSSRRTPVTGTDAPYTFVLNSTDAATKLTVTVGTIPDQDWVLLSQVTTAAS